MDFSDNDVTPGEGCRAVPEHGVVCELEGIDRFRIIGGDGDDFIAFKASLPVIADLGPGDDELRGQTSAVTISAGEGDDVVGLGVGAGMVELGPGRDQIDAELHWAWEGSTPLRLAGGDFHAAAGPLRVRLPATPTGRRWLRRDPTLPLFVYVRTRKGEDRTVIRFWSRLG